MSDGIKEKGKRFADGQRGNTRGHLINGAARKDERRKAAFAREAAFDKLSVADKLKSLPPEGAQRQRARYTELLAKQAAKASQQSDTVKQAKAMVDSGEAVSLSEAKRKITTKKHTVRVIVGKEQLAKK